MRKVSTLVGLSLFALAGMARAQEEAPAPAPEAAAAPAGDAAAAPAPAPEATPAPAAGGTDYVSRGLTLDEGNLQVTVPIVINLSKERVAKPIVVPLDVRYGVTKELTAFLTHSGPGFPLALPSAPPAVGGGVCIGGEERGCAKLYNNLAVGAQYSVLKDNGLELAPLLALDVRSLDPMWLAIDVGLGFKYASGPIAIKATPAIGVGATKRDAGNKENISVPLQVAFQATPELAIFLDTGFFAPVKDMGKLYTVPVGVGAGFAALPNLDVGAAFMMPMIVKGSAYEGVKVADYRTAVVFASWRLK